MTTHRPPLLEKRAHTLAEKPSAPLAASDEPPRADSATSTLDIAKPDLDRDLGPESQSELDSTGPSADANQIRYPFNEPLPPITLPSSAPAMRHANLSPAACRRAAGRRGLPFKRDRRPTPGVATAFRFTGPVDGIHFLTGNWRTPFGVLDCRLGLALADLTEVLVRHRVRQVLAGTIYRPRSKLRSGVPSQHGHGLAADIVGFRLGDGTELNVERDWPAVLGAPPCGEEASISEATDASVALRNLVCDIARGGHFHVILTPNYDRAHHDHVHLDIKRGARRRIIR